MNNNNLILISGTMRSGTTLMSVMINAHPDISIITDKITWFWNKIYPYYDLDTKTSLETALYEQEYYISRSLKLVQIEFNKFKDHLLCSVDKASVNPINTYLQIHNIINPHKTNYLGDKSTHSYRIYEKFITEFNGKIIHMVRNPFDVYYSQHIKVQNDKYENSFLNGMAKYYRNIREVKDKVCTSFLSNQKKSYLDMGAMTSRNIFFDDPISIVNDWVKSNNEAIKLMSKYPDNIFIVKYEDLIQNREKKTKSIMEFLDCRYNKDYFEFNKLKDEKGQRFVSNSSFKIKTEGYDKSRVGKGKKNISNKEINYILTETNHLLNKLGY